MKSKHQARFSSRASRPGFTLVEVLAAVVTQVVDHQRRVGQQSLHGRPLVVEHPQRIEHRAFRGRLVQVQAG